MMIKFDTTMLRDRRDTLTELATPVDTHSQSQLYTSHSCNTCTSVRAIGFPRHRKSSRRGAQSTTAWHIRRLATRVALRVLRLK